MLFYLWTNKTTGQPYIGFVDGKLMEHPELIIEKRARMKIMMVDPLLDMPGGTLTELLAIALALRN